MSCKGEIKGKLLQVWTIIQETIRSSSCSKERLKIRSIMCYKILAALCVFQSLALPFVLGDATAYSEHIDCYECNSLDDDDCADGEAAEGLGRSSCEDPFDVCFKETLGERSN